MGFQKGLVDSSSGLFTEVFFDGTYVKGVPVSVEGIGKSNLSCHNYYCFFEDRFDVSHAGTRSEDIYSCLCFSFTSFLVSLQHCHFCFTTLCYRLANMQMVAGVLVSLTQKFSTAIVINGMEPAV